MAQTKRRLALTAAALLAVAAPRVAAQTVRGTVVDSASTQPLGAVTVELIRADSQVAGRATTDEQGRFSLAAPEPGRYRIRAQRIGFSPYDSPVTLSTREVNMGIALAAVPVELAPVRVEAVQDEFLLQRGFYQRRDGERGIFLDPAMVEKKLPRAKVATDVLLGIPGVRIVGGTPHLRSCTSVTQSSGDQTGFPTVYIDGVKSGRDVAYFLQPNEILAVEVYLGPAQIPLQYGGAGLETPCGVILIWTRH